MSAGTRILPGMHIVTVLAVAGSVASCLAVIPLGIAGVRRTRSWWQGRRYRRIAATWPLSNQTTVDTSAYRQAVNETDAMVMPQWLRDSTSS